MADEIVIHKCGVWENAIGLPVWVLSIAPEPTKEQIADGHNPPFPVKAKLGKLMAPYTRKGAHSSNPDYNIKKFVRDFTPEEVEALNVCC